MRPIDLDALLQFPIRANHYDRENGSEEFVFGVESVLDYAENLPPAYVEQKWTSVKDKMPPEYYDYKANCSTSDLVLVAVVLGDGNQFVCDDMVVDGKWYIHEDNVTHWMPMPGLPKEEEYEFNT